MRSLRGFVSMTVLALAASCSSDPKSVAPAPATDGDMTDSAGGHVGQCHPTCTAASDCAVPGSTLDDASHFACTAGTCVWQGCQSDAECNTDAPTGAPHLVCRPGQGAPVPICVAACSTPADCASADVPLGDAAHFACTAGLCVWQGCRSTSECASALHVQKVVCEEPPGAPAPTCEPTCTKAADCADSSAPLEDASHFACKAGRCQWLGCKSTADCTSGLHSSHYVCE
jgi:hypothetical protein